MKAFAIKNIGEAGLNSDIQPWDLPPDNITYGLNFRSTYNVLETTHGYDLISIAPAPYNPGHIMAVDVGSGSFFIIPGLTAIQVYDGTNWTDVSSVAGYSPLNSGDELLWTSAMLGSIPIINNPQVTPEYWSPQQVNQILQPLQYSPTQTWLEANKSFKVIRSHKNYLFALNLTESGIDLPNSYRWSHPADINGLPYTWDPDDLASNASIEQVSGDSGSIVDGLTLRDSFCIYSERGISILDPSGEYIFSQRELSNSFGLISQDALVEVNGIHYFLGDGDIYVNDGNSIRSITYGKIKTRFNSQINGNIFNLSYALVNKADKEIWFVVPENESPFPDTIYIYNWETGVFGIKRIATEIVHAAYGTVSSPQITINLLAGTWDSTTLKYNTASPTPLSKAVVAISNSTSSLYTINQIAQGAETDLGTRIERTGLSFEGADKVTMVTRIYPLIEGAGNVNIQIGSQDFAGGPVSWKPQHLFNPATDRKLDIRTTGEYHAWRVDSIGTSRFRMSGMIFEYANAGKR